MGPTTREEAGAGAHFSRALFPRRHHSSCREGRVSLSRVQAGFSPPRSPAQLPVGPLPNPELNGNRKEGPCSPEVKGRKSPRGTGQGRRGQLLSQPL